MNAILIVCLLTLQNFGLGQKLADNNDLYNRTKRQTSNGLTQFSFINPRLNLVIYRVLFHNNRKFPLVVSAIYDNLNRLNAPSLGKSTSFIKQNSYLAAQRVILTALTGAIYSTLNGIDRGHMFPWADWRNFNQEDTKLTLNTYYNCAPQYSEFNRGPWGVIESDVRNVILSRSSELIRLCISWHQFKILYIDK